jgi:NAD(P)-dependent dehydrogenase (short-subunit alcohol dehydrogenase family)
MEGIKAVITGASRGLGRALALELARNHARLAVLARDKEPLVAVADEIERLGGQAHPIQADLGVERDIDRAAARIHDALGPVDVLVNNAATLGPTPLPLLLDLDPVALARAFDVNVVGPFRLTRALVGPMALRGQGLVLALSSDAAVESYPRWGAYGASKAAQDHLFRTFAAELEGTGVRFVIADPGEMDTEMHADALPDADRSTLRRPEAVARWLVNRLIVERPAANGARLVVEV